MFTGLFFLLLLLLIIGSTPDQIQNTWENYPKEAFAAGMALYGAVLLLIILQNLIWRARGRTAPAWMEYVANIELLIFFTCFNLYLNSPRWLAGSVMQNSSQLVLGILNLSLYFIALFLHHATSQLVYGWRLGVKKAKRQFILVVPFILPFLLFAFLVDLVGIIPTNPHIDTNWLNTGLFLALLLLLLLCMLFLPIIVTSIWKCAPLKEGVLKERLDAICRKANFRHGGMQVWGAMEGGYTAAIIGLLPNYRYVMFTRNLLHTFPQEEVEAILAHEIGHNKHRHLWLYPLIFLGLIVLLELFWQLMGLPLTNYIQLLNLIATPSYTDILQPLLIVLPYVVIGGLYFRFVFGFFSRLFERQADLSVLELGLPAEPLASALDRIGLLSGGTHEQPNWHHYSLARRIRTVLRAAAQPEMIRRQRTKVITCTLLYSVLLFLGSMWVMAPYFPGMPFFKNISSQTAKMSERIDTWLNTPYRLEFAEHYAAQNELPAPKDTVIQAVAAALKQSGSKEQPGILEFYSAQNLYNAGEYASSGYLMTDLWSHISEREINPVLGREYRRLTIKILNKLSGSRQDEQLRASLADAILSAKRNETIYQNDD